jgi:hypothetical protein
VTFKSFRDKAQWIALTSALILFALDMYCRVKCYDISTGAGIDKTPGGLMPVWGLLIPFTFLSGLVTLPRWQSFIALLVVGWVTLLSIGSDWPQAGEWFN